MAEARFKSMRPLGDRWPLLILAYVDKKKGWKMEVGVRAWVPAGRVSPCFCLFENFVVRVEIEGGSEGLYVCDSSD